MKITYSILGLTAGAAMLLTSGCGNEQQPTGEPPKPASPAASETQPAAETAKAAVEQVKSTATAAAEQAATTAKTQTEAAVTAVTTQAQEIASQASAAPAAVTAQAQQLIDKAKGLVSNEKYQEALNVVQQLASMKLTPEQQKLVDDLKPQIQAALAKAAGSNAASALGNILGGKK